MKINLTPRAEWVKEKAINLAKSCGHEILTLEHLLTAILLCEDAKTVILLNKTGLNVQELGQWMREEYFSRLEVTGAEITIVEEVEEVFKIAQDFSSECDDGWVSVDHIFIGLIQLLDKLEEVVLDKMQFDHEAFEKEVVSFFKGETFFESYGDVDKNTEVHQDGAETKVKDLSLLLKYGEDLNSKCFASGFDIKYRDREIEKIEYILNRKQKNNVLLVGDSGTGKTAIVECLAHRISNNKCSYFLEGRVVFSLNLTSLVSGSKYRGEFERKLQEVIDTSKKSNVVLFIDEVHTLTGAGESEGSLDAANILKPYLSQGEITIIGATTQQEYRRTIAKDKAFSRRFDVVTVKEPSKLETFKILQSRKKAFEDFHFVSISKQNLEDVVDFADKHVKTSHFPDKAFDLLDLACSHCKVNSIKKPVKLQKIEDKIISIATGEDKIPLNEGQKTLEKYHSEYNTWLDNMSKNKVPLLKESIIEVLAEKINIPKDRFSKSDSDKYLNLEDKINSKVFGQKEAVGKVCKSLLRYKTGLRDHSKPIGTFLFLGETGLGKTYLGKVLAKEVFISESNFVKLDMSEYSESHSVAKLIGSPPGYVGFNNGGFLIEKVIKNPFSVVLFDEIEKAHPDVQKVLLQILEDGVLTDAMGRTACFKNCIIIVTGNIASNVLSETNSLGFGGTLSSKEKKESAFSLLKKKMPLELINRFDDIIFFDPFEEKELKNIIKNELEVLSNHKEVKVKYNSSVIDFVYKNNKDNEFGARQIKRYIQKEILDPLSSFVIKNPKRKNIKADFDNSKNKLILS